MCHCQICSFIQWVVLLMVSFSVQKFFSLIWSYLFIFLFVSLTQGDTSAKILLWQMSEILLPIFPSRIFMVSNLTFKLLIHFKFIFLYGLRKWSNFIFFMYLSNFPNTVYWRDYFYSMAWSCLLCQMLIDHKVMGCYISGLSILFHWSIGFVQLYPAT